MNVNDRDFQAVIRLWRELGEFPASQSDAALAHCLRELARLLGADNAFWVGAVREREAADGDRLCGWRPRALTYLHYDDEYMRRLKAVLEAIRADQIDPMTQANVAHAGSTRAALRGELVEDAVWHRSWLYNDVLRPLRIEDRLTGVHAVDPKRESYIGLDRGPGDRPFGRRERDLLELFMSGYALFHRELMRSYGLLDAAATLSPRERDVLQLLLTDKSESEIAETLGLSRSTVHHYVLAILAAFKVRRRVGLMAKWLRV